MAEIPVDPVVDPVLVPPDPQLDANGVQIAIDPAVFLETEATVNPVPDLQSAVAIAEQMRYKKLISNRVARTTALLAGLSIEAPRTAPDPLPDHLYCPRAKGER